MHWATICSTGRTEAEFNQQGTGTGLYIQTGPNPASDYITIPLKESEVQGTKWTLGKCFYGMGVHYWYNLSEDMSCNDFAPIFLLYNKGKLNAFGWAFQGNYPSTRYEHPSQNTFGLFMKAVPKCLKTVGTISTLHIYLTRTPALNFC
ncbi:uncharacterized protein LOC106167568 [Lingula anatina]|uniref:Uncharacterized protein LOC106167568 n=1 Tax=Lingula anatina TaxID=7574 RepID=A0A1S3IW96_LINAN|nr:uncharacterized protein LOC106167568 [Lingula anatina]|eukprot:XP_013401824.1 uncharacterized protein LOC106167568 [Lingula anatina]